MRAVLSGLLLLVAVVLSFPASLAVWEQRVLMNEDRFVELGKDVLARNAVQRILSTRIQTEVVAIAVRQGADGPRADTLSRPVVQAVVAELPTSSIGEASLRATHRLVRGVIREDEAVETEDGHIVLDLGELVRLVAAPLGIAGIIRADAIPPDAGRILLVREQDVSLALDAVRRFDGDATYIALAPIVVLLVGLVIASNRGIYLMVAGFLFFAAAALRIIGVLGVGPTVIAEAAVVEPSARAAADAAYGALAWSFVWQDVVVCGIAAGVAVFGLLVASFAHR